MNPKLRLVVLDLAGTTVRDSGQVTTAFTRALFEQGISVTDRELAAVRGASKREAIGRFIPEGRHRLERANAAYGAFREHLAAGLRAEGVQPIEGAELVFRHLRSEGVRVALNTGFDRDVTNLLLNALHWGDGVVDAVICGDDVIEGRPAPYLIFRAMEATRVSSVHDVMNVGDTTLDLHAGHNAGVRWNVGVLSGAHDRAALQRAPHTHLVGSVADLHPFVCTLLKETPR
jgi:phosphonatase-like hydrolase